MDILSGILVGILAASSASAKGIIDSQVERESLRFGSSLDTSIFTTVHTSSLTQLINNTDGYTQLQYRIWKTPYTAITDLWVFQVYLMITPGYVAHQYNTWYDEGAHLGKGTVELRLRPYSSFVGNATGGSIYEHQLWPLSSTVVTTITSSLSTTVAYNFGMETGVGYSAGNGASLSQTFANSTTLSFTWTKSSSSVGNDPLLSAQASYDSGEWTSSWFYQTQSPSVAGILTYHLDCFAAFEIGTNYYNCSQDCFHYEIEVHTWDYYHHWLTGWNFGTEYSGSTSDNWV